MSTSDARHGRRDYGRRDNGLVAAEYAAAGDVDPRVGEHLLDVLALEGIAAYLCPSTDLHPVTRQTSLPARPTDRLYVDRAHLTTARDYLTRLAQDAADAEAADQAERRSTGPAADPASGPGPTLDGTQADKTDIDNEWAKIVAEYDAEVDSSQRSWPVTEDLGDDAEPHGAGDKSPAATTAPARPLRRIAESDETSLLDGLDTFGAGLPDDGDEDGYTPPAPPPVPRPSLPSVLGVAGIVCGLFIFLRPTLLPLHESTAMIIGFIGIMSGFGTLVWRLRPGDEDEVDPDDGARV